jgi:hypothetical protein
MTGERMGYFTVVPSVPPGAAAENALIHIGDYISLKNYNRCSVVLQIGTAVTTRTLRIQQARNVAGDGAKALNFEAIWRTGARLYFDPATRNAVPYVVGEVVTGAGAGSAVIHEIYADHLVVHTWNGIVFVANEVLAGAGGATSNLIGANFFVDEDILCREIQAAPANTFVAPNVSDMTYVFEFAAEDLDVSGGFDCLLADISAVGAADDTARSVTYILSQPRYKNEPMETAIYD